VMVRQVGEERREVRIVFSWMPSDGNVVGGVERPQLVGEVVDVEELKPKEVEVGRIRR
jgi:hypothetical protein